MTKTLWCEVERIDNFTAKHSKVTATKVDELISGRNNLYVDAAGNYYITWQNKFQRRLEFMKVETPEFAKSFVS